MNPLFSCPKYQPSLFLSYIRILLIEDECPSTHESGHTSQAAAAAGRRGVSRARGRPRAARSRELPLPRELRKHRGPTGGRSATLHFSPALPFPLPRPVPYPRPPPPHLSRATKLSRSPHGASPRRSCARARGRRHGGARLWVAGAAPRIVPGGCARGRHDRRARHKRAAVGGACARVGARGGRVVGLGCPSRSCRMGNRSLDMARAGAGEGSAGAGHDTARAERRPRARRCARASRRRRRSSTRSARSRTQTPPRPPGAAPAPKRARASSVPALPRGGPPPEPGAATAS
jgi:hypothetical protein